MSNEWYYAKGDQKQGPIKSSQLKALAKSGDLKPTDLVWTEGMKDWRPALSIKGLIAPAPSSPPPLNIQKPIKPPVSEAAEIEDSIGSVDTPAARQPWFCHWVVLTLTTLVFFPVTLVLVWSKSTYSTPVKWAWTGAACFMAAAIFLNKDDEKGAPDVPQVSAVETPESSKSPIKNDRKEDVKQSGDSNLSPDLRQFVETKKRSGLRAYRIDDKLWPAGMQLDTYLFIAADGKVEMVVVTTPGATAARWIAYKVPGGGEWDIPSGYPEKAVKSIASLQLQVKPSPPALVAPEGSVFIEARLEIDNHIFNGTESSFAAQRVEEIKGFDLLVISSQSRCVYKHTGTLVRYFDHFKRPQATTDSEPGWADYKECSLVEIK